MDFITLDFETAYRSGKNKGTPGPSYSLSGLTYEEYIWHPDFKIHCVGIKRNKEPTKVYPAEEVENVLREIFSKPVVLVCHNTLFDGAILCWRFGLTAAQYICTQAMSDALWSHAPSSLDVLTKRLFPNNPSKHKTKELESVDGLWDLTEQQYSRLATYCANDVDRTFDCLAEMWKFFPNSEFPVMHLTLRMFIEPALELDRPRIEAYGQQLEVERAQHIANNTKQLADVVSDSATRFYSWVQNQTSGILKTNEKEWADEIIRSWKHQQGYTLRKPRQKDTPKIIELMNYIDSLWGTINAPSVFEAMAYRVYMEFGTSPVDIAEKVLASTDLFALYLIEHLGIDVPRKLSPTPINPKNTSWALAKDDLEFLEIQKKHQAHGHLWRARLCVSSTVEQARITRLMSHAEKNQGKIAVPLKYCAAHTKRWGGTNSVNFQNFPRGSEIRKSLVAPEGHKIVVADLSNIESRVLAWFAGCEELLTAYRDNRDIYSEYASDAFGRRVDRKRRAKNDAGEFIDKDGNVTDKDGAHQPDYVEGLVGKVCLAWDTKVLTNHGWKNIVLVNHDDLLWDGEEWVQHSGLIFQGLKTTYHLHGLGATGDHEILTEHGFKEWQQVHTNPSLYQSALAVARLPSSTGNKNLSKVSHKVGTTRFWKWIEQMSTKVMSLGTSVSLRERKTPRTNGRSKTLSNAYATSKLRTPVYDLANAGPQHRFTVLTDYGPVLVHNCILGLGYGMGPPTLQNTFAKGAMGADPIYFDLDFCNHLVNNLYRTKYPEIPACWRTASQVIMDMASPHLSPYSWGPLQVEPGRLRLPGGLYLTYPRIKRVETDDEQAGQYVYWNGDFWKKIYGGLLVENIVQALARLLMAAMLVRIDKELQLIGARVVLTVHDEIVAVAPDEQVDATLKIMLDNMAKNEPWCADGTLTLAAEGGYAQNYSK